MAERGRKKELVDSKFREELKKELKQELKKEILSELKQEDFEEKVQEHIKKDKKEKGRKSPSTKGVYWIILVFLVILILVIDLLSLSFYYGFDLNLDFIKNFSFPSLNLSISGKTCRDGTLLNTCSSEKPYYCYEGELLKKAATCGCPSGYKVDFQDCVKLK